jgi:hypothetical protein
MVILGVGFAAFGLLFMRRGVAAQA